MGGKNVGCGCLEYLLKNKKEIVAVFVNPNDKSRGRWYRSAAEIAQFYKIKVYKSRNINSPNNIRLIKKLNPELIVVVYFDQILKRELINIPKYGCINLHLALSQVHRGCYPTTWSLIRGDKYTGVTLHCITEKIDGGPIIAQKKIKIRDDWTGKDIYNKVSDLGIKLFEEIFPNLDKVKPYFLNISKSKYYEREFPSRKIKLDRETCNKIRALIFEPFPPPYIKIGKRKFIFKEIKE